jgi:adenylate cyclase
MHARRLRHAGVTLLITVVVATLIGAAQFVPQTGLFLRKAEYTAHDALLRLRGPMPRPSQVTIVEIDSASVGELGGWPFPRSLHARLIERLSAWGAKVIAFDVVFDAPRGDAADRALVRACRRAGNVLVAANLETLASEASTTTALAGARWQYPFPELADVCGVGYIGMDHEEDTVVRRASLFSPTVASIRAPALSVLAAARFLGHDPDAAVTPGALRLGETVVPLDAEGKFWINYTGAERAVLRVPYYQVVQEGLLSAAAAERAFRDRVVFVGATDPMLHDAVSVPNDASFPGVEVHANITHMLLGNRPLRRLPEGWALALATLGALAVGAGSVVGRPDKALLGLIGVAVVYAGVALALFRQGVWIPVVVPLAGAGASFVIGVLYKWAVEDRERRRISALFSKYVSKDVARELMENEQASQLGRSRKQRLTCLFSDIRGFTTMSERLEPEQVVTMLNEYFDRMVDVVFAHRGTLDKYVGDAIMATFGVPKSYGNDAERACRTAVRMREELEALQRQWAAEGKAGIDIGIGVNTGDAVVGNIGHRDRLEFACIGDTINTASRLESLNKELGTKILISESTYNEVKDLGLFAVRRLPAATVKGKAEAVQVYELLGWAEEAPETAAPETATVGQAAE